MSDAVAPGQADGRESTPTAAELEVLRSRARDLARRGRATRDDDALEMVVFAVRGETCALELRHLRQTLPVKQLALLPGVRPPLVAVAAWRGELVGVFDLAHLLGRGTAPPSERRHLLVIGERAPVALLVDEIVEMRTIPLADLAPPPGDGSLLRGVTPAAVLVLDGVELLGTLNREAT